MLRPYTFVVMSVRRSLVGLAVVYLVPGVFCLDLEGVELPVCGRWCEGDAVFVADKLGDFSVGASEFLRILREINAATCGMGELLQPLIGFPENLLDEGARFAFVRGELLVLGWLPEIACK